ncbi:hypothetical protein Taro_043588 [Colocasia esculenta]|uniref:Uncharacterized protein n=1 Tax=Colocasia esculenta TaxID=4460 RepID=A0A843X4B3_COLES|nr:hypothetical protein [Colocasia esculenta]
MTKWTSYRMKNNASVKVNFVYNFGYDEVSFVYDEVGLRLITDKSMHDEVPASDMTKWTSDMTKLASYMTKLTFSSSSSVLELSELSHVAVKTQKQTCWNKPQRGCTTRHKLVFFSFQDWVIPMSFYCTRRESLHVPPRGKPHRTTKQSANPELLSLESPRERENLSRF